MLAVCRMPVVYEIMTVLPKSPHSSLDECLPGVQEVMGPIPVWNSDFLFVPCFCHVDQFTFHYQAQNSPSLFTYHNS